MSPALRRRIRRRQQRYWRWWWRYSLRIRIVPGPIEISEGVWRDWVAGRGPFAS